MTGDALTYQEIAEIITEITGKKIEAVQASLKEVEESIGEPFGAASAEGYRWNDMVNYPATPAHLAKFGLSTASFRQWTLRQDWSTLVD